MPHTHSRERGATLIEALVALLVLALGVMGMAAVQVRTLAASRDTNLHAVALQLTEDLMDRMLANRDVRLTPPQHPNPHPYVTAMGAVALKGRPAPDCFARACDGEALALFDLLQWKAAVAAALPNGDAQVFQSTSDASQFGVLFAWSEIEAKNQGSASDPQRLLYRQAIAVRDATGAVGTGSPLASCGNDQTCHLVFIRP